MRYERKCHTHFLQMYPGYGASQWIKFCEQTGRVLRWAQPDGLLIDYRAGLITILEMKIRHTENAWWALRHLYEPLIGFLFGPSWRVASCEVVRWFDPAVPWPEPYRRVAEPALLRPGELGVHIWDAR